MRKIAGERIEILFRQAEEEFPEHKERSNRYVELARRISKKYKVRIPKELKKRFCKYCYSYLKPGVNCSVGLDSEKNCVVYKCEECKKKTRYNYFRSEKEKK